MKNKELERIFDDFKKLSPTRNLRIADIDTTKGKRYTITSDQPLMDYLTFAELKAFMIGYINGKQNKF